MQGNTAPVSRSMIQKCNKINLRVLILLFCISFAWTGFGCKGESKSTEKSASSKQRPEDPVTDMQVFQPNYLIEDFSGLSLGKSTYDEVREYCGSKGWQCKKWDFGGALGSLVVEAEKDERAGFDIGTRKYIMTFRELDEESVLTDLSKRDFKEESKFCEEFQAVIQGEGKTSTCPRGEIKDQPGNWRYCFNTEGERYTVVVACASSGPKKSAHIKYSVHDW